MPLFSSGHANDTSIQYSTVESEPAQYLDDSQGGHKAFDHNNQAKQPSVDINTVGITVNSSQDDKGSNTYAGPPIKGWPTEPQRLRGYSLPLLIGDILLILLPIGFIVLAISAWRLDAKELSGTGKMVERAMNLGPTIFPLAFAAIGSRCLRSIAVRIAERGTSILTLEKLLGSQSLVSAIGTACSLRSANLISLGLLLLWALSPLGGQSSLRLLHETNSTISENGTVYYSDHAAPADYSEAMRWFPIVPTVLTASLATSVETKLRPVDSWNHPRVPRLGLVEQNALQNPSSEGTWVDVDPKLNQTYTSWTGINIQNLRPSEQSVFQVRYNYMYLDQQDVSSGDPKVIFDELVSSYAIYPPLLGTPKNDEDALNKLSNLTGLLLPVEAVKTQKLLIRIAYPLESAQFGTNMTGTGSAFNRNREPISFLYGVRYLKAYSESTYTAYRYTPRIVTVDAQIECQSGDCIVTRLRHVPNESPSSIEDACLVGQEYRLGCMTTATETAFHFMRYLPGALAMYLTDGISSAGEFEDWIKGKNITFDIDAGNLTLNGITDQEKSDRLTVLLNTYWQASSWGYQITRAASFDRPEYPWAGDSESRTPIRYINATEATFSHLVPIYRADIGWIVGLLIISTILLVLGIVNVAFAFMTVAPDLFYYASSLARENPYTKTPDGGTALDGGQRSRMLRDLKVQIADVSPENRVGYVVFKSVEDDDFQTGRLKKDRLYCKDCTERVHFPQEPSCLRGIEAYNTKWGSTNISNSDRAYNYTGRVRLIEANQSTQITFKGCVALCGEGNQYYTWPVISATLTTWILPILGTLLQAPFESNAFWRTIKACNRWIGSPISSLATILWDVGISGKCALFVDMAVPYDSTPDQHSEFASIRDSFYILMNLNQYKMKPVISMTREAEGLLRIALFSKELKLIGTHKTLSQKRLKLAHDLRSNRRKGVVPIFLSTLWFILALGISIEAAFGDLGSNLQAHNLAMGLFISWLPIIILCSILDRNPVASDDIQRKLSNLVDLVCDSLLDHDTRTEYIASFADLPQAQHMAYWVEKIAAKAEFIKGDYFHGFAGQARTRFHYGAAYAILIDIEKAYITEHGRNWFGDAREARAALVLGQVDQGCTWFDGRQLWTVLASVVLVGGTSVGGFVLSFNTPTVGLGCRTGGYVIFFVIALVLLIAEIAVWWLTSPLRDQDQFHANFEEYAARTRSRRKSVCAKPPALASSRPMFNRFLEAVETLLLQTMVVLLRLTPAKHRTQRTTSVEAAIRAHFFTLRGLTARNWLQRAFFTPLEFANLVWACYLLAAQTIGAFNNCACMTSIWGGFGGYLDFTQLNVANSTVVEQYWIIGTILTCSVMGLGMSYIVLEWLLQAHLSTEDYDDAMIGLRRVRKFRFATLWIRYPLDMFVRLVTHGLNVFHVRGIKDRRVMLWTKATTFRPSVEHAVVRIATDAQRLPFQETNV
ncbi:hypothetical protein OPT61_g9296 [Boeremia exigua]|uniref:Uncharacterized protein n=1 Tax=Boeremia exigua TaxID=749465 RepID=A0ACC2HV00_9PLEO|nr:hypothetical protein OPT61_g9296 [Boeremia exigua]